MSDRNHFVVSGSPDSFDSYTGSELPADSARTFREGLPPAFRMRADAHYVEQLDGATPAITVQYIAAHAIDVSDAPANALPALVESIRRNGVLEPLVVQRNNGTYKTLAGHKRLAAALLAGLNDVPCIVHHVSDERAEVLRELLRTPAEPAAVAEPEVRQEVASASAQASSLDVAIAAVRLIADAPDGTVSIVKTATGARLSIDLPFGL